MELKTTPALSRSSVDVVGMLGSFACLLHCTVMPLLIPSIPALLLVSNDTVHLWLAIPLSAIAAYSLFRAYLDYGSRANLLIGLLGVSLLLAALKIPHAHVGTEIEAATVVTILGSILLVHAHLKNFRRSRLPFNS